ncbi:hypothetical protein AGMMS50239_34110 [Bacteroidia bacterium]|nr:hypothetical protein AGMMS50239_34110 [Bacteroidia bacterium]
MFEIFMLYLSIPDRINFLQSGRYSRSGEQRFRRQFESGFDFFSFNQTMVSPYVGKRNAVADDTSFIHKSGKHTPGTGYFWSGCAGKTFRELEVLSLSLIDVDSRMSFHLKATQTLPANCLSDNALSLPDWYAALLYLSKQAPTGKRGSPSTYTGKVNPENLDTACIEFRHVSRLVIY